MQVLRYTEKSWSLSVAAITRPMCDRPGGSVSERIVVLLENPVDAVPLRQVLYATRVRFRARGRWLFALHPWIRQLLMAFCALADEHDVAAELGLLAPPFFALEVKDRVFNVALGKEIEASKRAAWEYGQVELAALRRQAALLTPGAVCILLADLAAGCLWPSEFEQDLFWGVVDVIEQLSWQRGDDPVGFVEEVHGWLRNPADFACRLRVRAYPVEVAQVSELEPGEKLSELVILPSRSTSWRIQWRVENGDVVSLASTRSVGERKVRVVHRLHVPEDPTP